MHEVTKEEFKNIYFKHGKPEDGWGQDYWYEFYEHPGKQNMKYMIDLPDDVQTLRMMVANDYSLNEYRLFFVSTQQMAQEALFFNASG